MKVETNAAGIASLNERRQAADKALQGVFSEVLAQAGRQGYASAETSESEQPLTERVAQAWDDWFQLNRHTRADVVDSVDQLQRDYGNLLQQAQAEDAYVSPQAFLSTLNAEQLQTVQHTHRLANPIQVDQLTEEGALNLLIPPPAQVDSNGDGLTQSGIGYGIRFPDSRTPPEVVAAWDAATADLEPQEKAWRMLQMKFDVLLANMHLTEDGRFSHRVEPGEPGFVNPMDGPGYSYVEKTRARLEAIEYFKQQTPPEQYERDRKFWTEFQAQLLEFGAE